MKMENESVNNAKEEKNVYSRKRGWWQESSSLDLLDKRLSKPFFSLELGYYVETLLTIPGTWFGLPTPAFTLANLFTFLKMSEDKIEEELIHWLPVWMQTHLFASHAHNFAVLSLGIVAIWSLFFFVTLTSNNISQAYRVNAYLFAPSVVMPIWLGSSFSTTGYRATVFFLVNWFLAQAACTFIKVTSARTRPMKAETSFHHINTVTRSHPSMSAMLSQGHNLFESFPSGDTVGSAVFSCVLVMFLGAPWYYGLLSVLTAFGRMYFHVHHLLDVLVGLWIGWTVPLLLDYLGFGLEYFDEKHIAMVVGGFLVFYVALHRRFKASSVKKKAD